MSRPNIYSYTAATNPYFVKSLAHKYGYQFDKDQRLDTVLQQLVSYEGEPVLMEIIENNPDKDLFMEYFERKHQKKDEQKAQPVQAELATYMNFTGLVRIYRGWTQPFAFNFLLNELNILQPQ